MKTITLKEKVERYKAKTGYNNFSDEEKKLIVKEFAESFSSLQSYNCETLLDIHKEIRKGGY